GALRGRPWPFGNVRAGTATQPRGTPRLGLLHHGAEPFLVVGARGGVPESGHPTAPDTGTRRAGGALPGGERAHVPAHVGPGGPRPRRRPGRGPAAAGRGRGRVWGRA